jgi:hypothetical protein
MKSIVRLENEQWVKAIRDALELWFEKRFCMSVQIGDFEMSKSETSCKPFALLY